MSLLQSIRNKALTFWRQVCLPVWAFLCRVWARLRWRRPWSDPSADPIKHVFVLMLENHSFDQMLGAFKDAGTYSKLEGIEPGALRFNEDKDGRKYSQRAASDDHAPFDPDHEYQAIAEQLDGNHGGFVRNFQRAYPAATPEQLQAVMNYFPKGALPALHWLAETFTICDHWFSSVPGPTWTNRLFLLSGTSMGRVEMGSADNLEGFVGYNQTTVFELLEDAGIPWRIYFHDFPQSWLLEHQLWPRMIANYFPMGARDFETDLKNEGSDFPRFCFIEPQYFQPDQNDDHPISSAMAAQRLVARVYNAIRSQEDVWNSSLLVVLYDEHGGFFDHVPVPQAVAPSVPEGYAYHDNHAQCDFKSLGVRVPAVLVSPWVEQGIHDGQLDHTSVIKYVSEKWKLPRLTERVDAANDFRNVVLASRRDISKAPVQIPVAGVKPRAAMAREPEDETDHQRALRALCDKIEHQHLGPVEMAETRARVKAQAMPGNATEEMFKRTMTIAETIKAQGGKAGGD